MDNYQALIFCTLKEILIIYDNDSFWMSLRVKDTQYMVISTIYSFY